jgi:HEAT repeat protein
MRALLEASDGGSAAVAGIARARLQKSNAAADGDAHLLCALSSLDAGILAADPTLLSLIAERMGQERSSDECIAAVLSEIDLSSPQLLSLGSTILTHLRRSKQLTEAQTKLLEKAVPAALFAGEWRALAAQFTGKSRLMIRRIAASRGLGVEESTVLFDAVLLGETEGLGEGQPNGRPAEDLLRYEYTPAAAEGVLALGVRGRALVRDFLLGRRGTPMAREAIVTAARRQRATEFTPELKSAALSDKDEGVRASALEALSGMLRIEELVPAIRPLFSESSRDVLQPIAEFVAQNRAGFADHLTQGDIETIVASMLASSDSSLRGSVAGVLVNLNAHVPDELIEGSLTRLLLDEDKMARTEAIDVLPHFGARSVSALARALSDPDCERVLLPELARALTALARTEPRTTALLGQLIMLQKRFPRSAPLLEAIGAVADPQALALLEEQLQSDDAALRNAALAALTARQAFFSFSSEPYLAALIDAQIEDQVAKRFGEAFERLRPYSGAVPTSGAIARLPQFPWPPPQWSFKEVIPKSLIDAATLGGVSERLIGSLRAASRDYDYGLFEIPDGFVLLARLERIQPDGAPFSGRDRWNESTIPVRSLKDYLLELFLSPPGRFRIIAFAVAREEPLTGSATARLPTFGAGAKVLPQWIAQLPFVDREAYALVYTFQRYDGGKMVLNYAGSPSGLTHLIAAGIWGALQKSSRTADD